MEKREIKNVKTFSMREPLLRNMSKLSNHNDSNDDEIPVKKIVHTELRPRFLISRLKQSFYPISNTPQPITISIGKTLHDETPIYMPRKGFPALDSPDRTNNASITMKKHQLDNRNDPHVNQQHRELESSLENSESRLTDRVSNTRHSNYVNVSLLHKKKIFFRFVLILLMDSEA